VLQRFCSDLTFSHCRLVKTDGFVELEVLHRCLVLSVDLEFVAWTELRNETCNWAGIQHGLR